MSKYLSLPLLAEAVVLDVLCNFDCISFRKMDTKLPLDELDIILSTVTHFADAFSEMFGEILDSFCLKNLSEKEFIDFVTPRGLILSREKTFFNLMLACSFMSEIVYYYISNFNCFHFAKLAYKCLLVIMKSKFEDLFKVENGWQDLLSFCEKINQLVTVYSIKKSFSDNPIINININKSDSPSDEPLIKQFNSFNIGDSKMNIIEDCELQANLDGSLVDSDNLVGDEKIKRDIVKDGEFVDFHPKISNLSLLKDIKLNDKSRCDKPNKIEYLYELLTESYEHLNEILDLIDECGEDLYEFSGAEDDDLCGDKQKISAMVVHEMCSPQGDISICRCIASNAIHSNEMVRGGDEPSPSSTSDEESSEFPSESSDGRHSGRLTLNASDTGHFKCSPPTALDDADTSLKVSENKFNPCQCCQLCKGREDQYMRNWEEDFLKRYLEL